MYLSYAELVLAMGLLVHTFDFSLACPCEEIVREFGFTARANKMPIHLRLRSPLVLPKIVL